jgi:hypothetical protein
MSKPYKRGKKGAGRHVQLPEWLQALPAWATMKPGPRALYIEVKRRFNGTNNGKIILSHRNAAAALASNRNTVGVWFNDLQERGFIYMTQAPHLGPSGIGKASVWALDEMPTHDGKPARLASREWSQKQNPRTKNRTARPKKQASCDPKPAQADAPVLKIVTQ